MRYYDGADPDDIWAVKSAGLIHRTEGVVLREAMEVTRMIFLTMTR